MSHVTISTYITSVVFCILVITLVSKFLKKLLFKKCNTQHFQAEKKIYQGSKEFMKIREINNSKLSFKAFK